jgi:hypothetical protein
MPLPPLPPQLQLQLPLQGLQPVDMPTTKKQRALWKVRQYVQMDLLLKQQQQLQRLLRAQQEKQEALCLLVKQNSGSLRIKKNEAGAADAANLGCFGYGFDAAVEMYRSAAVASGKAAAVSLSGSTVVKNEPAPTAGSASVQEGVAGDDPLDMMLLDSLPIDMEADNGVESSWAGLM